MNLALELIGRAEGLSSDQIAKLEADVPAIAALVKLSIEAKPLLVEAMALYEKAKPLIAQATLEWAAVGPDVLMVLNTVAKSDAPVLTGNPGGGIGS